jgi:hypothetical protein
MHLPEGSNFTPAPAGAHRAVCIGFIDLGTQKVEYQGQASHKRLIRIRWELADEFMDDGKPFTISKRYTWSMSDKATLRKDLESWRGKPFEKADFGPSGFDTKKLLGVPCLITIVHKDGQNGIFANIAGISPLPKGMEKPGGHNNPLSYVALERGLFDQDAFDLLHEKTKEQIRLSPEYQEIVEGKVREPSSFDRSDLDDEIPF